MTTTTRPPAERYAQRSRQYLAKAQAEMARGDLLQASEKGWGAASQMLKALAAKRGWPHGQHAALYRVLDRIVDETGDPAYRREFAVASELHVNFYEEMFSERMVTERLADLTAFVDRVESLLGQG